MANSTTIIKLKTNPGDRFFLNELEGVTRGLRTKHFHNRFTRGLFDYAKSLGGSRHGAAKKIGISSRAFDDVLQEQE